MQPIAINWSRMQRFLPHTFAALVTNRKYVFIVKGTYRDIKLVHAIATTAKQLRPSSELQPTVR